MTWKQPKNETLIKSALRRCLKYTSTYKEFLASQPVIWKGKYRYYPCASCQAHFSRGKLDLDHINPVVDPQSGFIDWNTYIERAVNCPASNLQHLCRPCHKRKTKEEGQVRTQTKRALKAK